MTVHPRPPGDRPSGHPDRTIAIVRPPLARAPRCVLIRRPWVLAGATTERLAA